MTDAAILNSGQPGESQAESGHHIRVVSGPGGDAAAARLELTADGGVLHERLRAAIDELTVEVSAGLGVGFGK
jgi:hypothetical protein